MKEATRFRFKAHDVEEGDLVMLASRSGDYVLYTDYASAVTDIKRLEETLFAAQQGLLREGIARDRATKAIKALKDECPELWGDVVEDGVARVYFREDTLAALFACLEEKP